MSKKTIRTVGIGVLIFLVCSIFTYRYFNQPLVTKDLSHINKIKIINHRTKNEVVLNIKEHESQINNIFNELKAIETKTVRFPKHMEEQESDPFYSLTLYYDNDSIEMIETTETGRYFFRFLRYPDWVGGKSEKLFEIINEIVD